MKTTETGKERREREREAHAAQHYAGLLQKASHSKLVNTNVQAVNSVKAHLLPLVTRVHAHFTHDPLQD